jgi:hypothetical protein
MRICALVNQYTRTRTRAHTRPTRTLDECSFAAANDRNLWCYEASSLGHRQQISSILHIHERHGCATSTLLTAAATAILASDAAERDAVWLLCSWQEPQRVGYTNQVREACRRWVWVAHCTLSLEIGELLRKAVGATKGAWQ